MADKKEHIIYTAKAIQQYLTGKLNNAEMHAMEKAALDDPLLAAAIEGYAVLPGKTFDKELASLREKLSKQQTGKTVIMKGKYVQLLKIAAAVLMVGFTVAIIYTFNKKATSDSNAIASKSNNINPEIEERKTEGVIQDSTAAAATDLADNKTLSNATKPSQYPQYEDIPTPVRDTLFMYKPGRQQPPSAANDIAGGGYVPDAVKETNDLSAANSQPQTQPGNVENNEAISNNALAKQEADAPSQFNRKAAANQQVVRAQVVGIDNKPIPFANISTTDKKIATYADANGNISMRIPDTTVNVDVRSIGYLSKKVTLQAGDLSVNKIVLVEDAHSLNDKVIITGKTRGAITRERTSLQIDSSMDAEPIVGWNNYDKYIHNSITLSNEAPQNKMKGNVEVSFDVKDDGKITNIKIDKSLCADCDKAVLRAIKDGPKWKLKKGKKATARIRVEF